MFPSAVADPELAGDRRRLIAVGDATYDARIAARDEIVERPAPLDQLDPMLGQALGATRTAGAAGESSRSLLLTVMGEFLLPEHGEAWTQTILGLLDQLGVSDKAARQTLARMRDQGWLTSERVGRQTRWRLSERAVDVLTTGAERIYGFGRTTRPWDGTWLLLLASVPERDRNLRYRMNVGLSWAGFGSIGQGIWLSPWVEQERVIADLLDDLGVDATSFRGELGDLGSTPELAGRAWDLPELRARYDDFLADTDTLVADLPRGIGAAAELTLLVHRWRRFPFLDPDLPSAVLPSDWPGFSAARRFAELRQMLLPHARAWWHDRQAEFTPATDA